MSRSPLSLSGETGPLPYALLAPLTILSQHVYVAIVLARMGQLHLLDPWFWLFPIYHLTRETGATDSAVMIGSFVICLAAAALLTILSFRRANWAERGHGLALFAMVPTVQLAAAAILALTPLRAPAEQPERDDRPPADGGNLRHVVLGLLSGMTIIVGAVVVSASTFGAYGWGLFVMTPFLAGFTTGWFANRRADLSMGQTAGLVVAAGALGCAALLALALEGLMCIILIIPLGAAMAFLGGALGRALARLGQDPTTPFASVAALPLIFMIEAAVPPQLTINASEHVDIAASPAAVWAVVTADRPIAAPPGIVGQAGLAYAIGSHLEGEGVGSMGVGYFSTGEARAEVTVWQPHRELALRVLSQPPAMEEMSPYRRVHAPHVEGYFITQGSRWTLQPLPNGQTRLTLSAAHELRIDPVPYWGPIARWAIAQNMQRVLGDIEREAER
jgi:prepilin signal peptidase PulO-like enzyme (type II secretory pathway)